MNKTLLQVIGILNIVLGSIFIMSFFGILLGIPLVISGALFLNYSSLKDEELIHKKTAIKVWSIIFIFLNIVSAIMGFCVLNNFEKKEKTDPDVFRTNFLLILGTILILVACMMLINSTISSSFDFIKTIMLLVFSIIFGVLSKVMSKSVKLKFTSYIYWFIGCILLVSFYYSCGYYNLFGEYLSLSGNGVYLFISSSFAIATLLLIISYSMYKARLFARISYFTIYSMYIFLILHFSHSISIFSLLFSCILLLSSIISSKRSVDVTSNEYFTFNSIISYIFLGVLFIANIASSQSIYMLVANILYITNLFTISRNSDNNTANNIFIIIAIPVISFSYCYHFLAFDTAIICCSLILCELYFISYIMRDKNNLFKPVLWLCNSLLFINYIISYFSYNRFMPTIMCIFLLIIYILIIFIKDYKTKYLGEIIVQPIKALLLCFALSYLISGSNVSIGFMSYVIIWSNVMLLFSLINKNPILKNIYFIIAYFLLILCIIPININFIFRFNLFLMWVIGYFIVLKDKNNWLGVINILFYIFALLNLFLLFNYITFTIGLSLLNIIVYGLVAYLFRKSKSKLFTSLLFMILPYYSLIFLIDVPSNLLPILILIPYIPYTYLFTYMYTSKYKTISFAIELIINIIVLITLTLVGSIESLLFVGIASILMILYDVLFEKKSLLFSGIISLILNILIIAIKYWSSIPVWSYLLIGGIVIIAIITIKELKKK